MFSDQIFRKNNIYLFCILYRLLYKKNRINRFLNIFDPREISIHMRNMYTYVCINKIRNEVTYVLFFNNDKYVIYLVDVPLEHDRERGYDKQH